jgi:hypothetical protein
MKEKTVLIIYFNDIGFNFQKKTLNYLSFNSKIFKNIDY